MRFGLEGFGMSSYNWERPPTIYERYRTALTVAAGTVATIILLAALI